MGAMDPFDEAIDFPQPHEMSWPCQPECEPDREDVHIVQAHGGYQPRYTFTVPRSGVSGIGQERA
jgi:hypothetical protein